LSRNCQFCEKEIREGQKAGFVTGIVSDTGLTEISPRTITALVIAPDAELEIDKITEDLLLHNVFMRNAIKIVKLIFTLLIIIGCIQQDTVKDRRNNLSDLLIFPSI